MTSRVLHFDIPIDDPTRAGEFYGSVFGWTINSWGPVPYWTMTTGAEPGPGAEGALAPRVDAPEGVVIYVGVDDIAAALLRVVSAGGSVVAERAPIPGFGWTARFLRFRGESDRTVPARRRRAHARRCSFGVISQGGCRRLPYLIWPG